jgi:hypothetical protein
MTAELWEVWAEMSITHRDVHDADVAAVLHLIRKEAELEHVRREEGLAAPAGTVAE